MAASTDAWSGLSIGLGGSPLIPKTLVLYGFVVSLLFGTVPTLPMPYSVEVSKPRCANSAGLLNRLNTTPAILLRSAVFVPASARASEAMIRSLYGVRPSAAALATRFSWLKTAIWSSTIFFSSAVGDLKRSEERRVGKE